VQSPPLVRRGGETSREEMLFVLAQAGHIFYSFEDSGDFFLHEVKLLYLLQSVEGEMN